MKTFLLLFILLSSPAWAGSLDRPEPPIVGDRYGAFVGGQSGAAELGTYLWAGKYYRNARASLVNADEIQLSSTDGSVAIPWATAPAALKNRFASEREQMLAGAAQAKAAEETRAKLAAAGAIRVRGKVLRVADKVAVFVQRSDDFATVIVGGHPSQASLAEGDEISVWAVRLEKPYTEGERTYALYKVVLAEK